MTSLSPYIANQARRGRNCLILFCWATVMFIAVCQAVLILRIGWVPLRLVDTPPPNRGMPGNWVKRTEIEGNREVGQPDPEHMPRKDVNWQAWAEALASPNAHMIDAAMVKAVEGPQPFTPYVSQAVAGHFVNPSNPNCWISNFDPSNRCAPHWFILGASHAGSSALYHLMHFHPMVKLGSVGDREVGVRSKEPHFFDQVWDWQTEGPKKFPLYNGLFPLVQTNVAKEVTTTLVTGEATSNYIFAAGAPHALRSFLPFARVTAILREPIARAVAQLTDIVLTYAPFATEPDIANLFDDVIKEQLPGVKECLNTYTGTYSQLLECFAVSRAATVREDRQLGVERDPNVPSGNIPGRMEDDVRDINQAAGGGGGGDPKQRRLLFEKAQLSADTSEVDGPHRTLLNDDEELKKIVNKVNRLSREVGIIERGLYVYQVANWLETYKREELLIFTTEDLLQSPGHVMERIGSHLSLAAENMDWQAREPDMQRVIREEYAENLSATLESYPINPETRRLLVRFYSLFNSKLSELIKQPTWEY